MAARPPSNRSLASSGRWPSKEHHAVATASNLRCCSTGSCCCCYCILLLSDMLLQQLLLVTLLVAPMGGAPAAPAPAPQEDVGEEGGGKADIKVKLPGSITRRAELFQRPRPRYVVWSQLWCPDVGAALMIRQFSKVQMLFFIVTQSAMETRTLLTLVSQAESTFNIIYFGTKFLVSVASTADDCSLHEHCACLKILS